MQILMQKSLQTPVEFSCVADDSCGGVHDPLQVVMAALCSKCGHYIFVLILSSSSFFLGFFLA